MSNAHNTFFTSIGCMDGRVQKAIADYGMTTFHADFPDTITEPGLDGLLASGSLNAKQLSALAAKISISTDKHKSLGIVFHGHEDCAGNPVNEETHKENIAKSVKKLKELVSNKALTIRGVFVKVSPHIEVVVVI